MPTFWPSEKSTDPTKYIVITVTMNIVLTAVHVPIAALILILITRNIKQSFTLNIKLQTRFVRLVETSMRKEEPKWMFSIQV